MRPLRPTLTISAENMLYAQGATLSPVQRAQVALWAAYMESKDGIPYETFNVPVRDRNGTLIGHIAFATS
jgi:hypothetical protein